MGLNVKLMQKYSPDLVLLPMPLSQMALAHFVAWQMIALEALAFVSGLQDNNQFLATMPI